jgi:hypothetical protein
MRRHAVVTVWILLGVFAVATEARGSETPTSPPPVARMVWSRTLTPPPAYVSDALIWRDSLVVADRGASALRLYGPDGAAKSEMVGADGKRGALVGFVILAADGDRLFALPNRRALMSLDLPSLKLRNEIGSDLPGTSGRFLAFGSKFVLVGAGSRSQQGPKDPVDYVWSENQDQTPAGRRALWTVDPSLRRFPELIFSPLICKGPSGQIAAVRPDQLQMAILDGASGGRRVFELRPPPGYRARTRTAPPFDRSQRLEYLAWRGEASFLAGLSCSPQNVSILRGEGVGSQTAWFADVYSYDGKLQGSFSLAIRATRVVPLNSTCTDCVELLAVQGDSMDLYTSHAWVKYATAGSR